jgi:hypothetical protein
MKIAARTADHRRELEVMTTSIGWRLTAPLRLASRYVARRRSR